MSTWSISSAFARILDRAAERYRAHKSARDLIGLDHDEVERILRDVNLNMSDMLPQRLQLVGLDPHYIAATDIATYRDLQRSCMSCRSWRRCARDLARGEAQVGLASYCLNSQLIDGLLVGRLDASQARRITLQGSSAGAVNAE
jgi:hypothetical protein